MLEATVRLLYLIVPEWAARPPNTALPFYGWHKRGGRRQTGAVEGAAQEEGQEAGPGVRTLESPGPRSTTVPKEWNPPLGFRGPGSITGPTWVLGVDWGRKVSLLSSPLLARQFLGSLRATGCRRFSW